jgi:trk system potassium uptake protein TrkH
VIPARTICLGFLFVICVGALLLCLPITTASNSWSNPLTALFMSTSAVCVTGLAVVDVGSYYNFWGQLVLLLLIQVGGLGYMTATSFLLILIGKKFSLREKLTLQQSLDLPGMQGGIRVVRSIIVTTCLFEAGGAIALWFVWGGEDGLKNLWLSVFHSISAFNNAGFSLFSNSLMDYARSGAINLIIPALIISGGIGYQVLLELYLWLRAVISPHQHDPKTNFSLNFKVVLSTTVFLIGLGTVLLWITEQGTPQMQAFNWLEQLGVVWFQSVTTRTAGFNTIDLASMTTTALFVMIILMFIGASPGGTGGGIKTTTVRILAKCTQTVLQGKDEVILYNRHITTLLVFKAVGVVFGSLLVVLLSTLLLSITDRQFQFMELFFEATSAFATVGLSIGITSKLSVAGQIVIIGTMYIGRVGVLLLMGAFSGDHRPSLVKYPEEYMLVG